MTDKIHILDGSRNLHRFIPVRALVKLGNIRPVDVEFINDPNSQLDVMVNELFEPRRNQVSYDRLLRKINDETNLGKGQLGVDGKLIIIEKDFYAGNAGNWCFGGFSETNYGLGYILVSTARMRDEILAEQIFRHELGHMFRAPSKGRNNTIQYMGLHCTNRLCTMQQKDTVDKAQRFACELHRKGADYCSQCVEDIKAYRPLRIL